MELTGQTFGGIALGPRPAAAGRAPQAGTAQPAVVAVWCNSHPIVGRSACIAAVGEAQVLAWKAEEAEVDGSYEAACRLADERHHEVRAA